MRFHTTEQLGPKQSLTPDGFLLCSGVAIARTGTQRYRAEDFPEGHAPVEPGPDGAIQITRDEADVFRDETVASFEGKPVVIGHTFINPENFQDVAVGHAQNIRRGTGADSDLLFADLLINDAEAIEHVRGNLREVSCGYDADYEQTAPGYGRQLNIIGNHVALVDRGRAGPRCSIQDEETIMPALSMKQKLLALVRKAPTKDADLEKEVESMDEETAEEKEAREAKEAKEAKTADSISALTKTVDALVQTVAKLAKTKDGEESDEEKAAREAKEKKTADDAEALEASAMVGDAMSRAEILSPGFKMPTTDSVKTIDAAVTLQRKVLSDVAKTEAGAALLAPLLGKRTVDGLTADAVSAIFVAASELARAQNNAAGFKLPAGTRTKDFSTANQIADINKANAAFWSNR